MKDHDDDGRYEHASSVKATATEVEPCRADAKDGPRSSWSRFFPVGLLALLCVARPLLTNPPASYASIDFDTGRSNAITKHEAAAAGNATSNARRTTPVSDGGGGSVHNDNSSSSNATAKARLLVVASEGEGGVSGHTDNSSSLNATAQARKTTVASEGEGGGSGHTANSSKTTPASKSDYYARVRKWVDEDDERQRCARYGFNYTGRPREHRRRIFYGALIADDSREVLEAVATEVYDVFHTVAFVESDRTFAGTPREVKYGYGSSPGRKFLVGSGMYGNKTKVSVDMFGSMPKDWDGDTLIPEQLQRELIPKRWKRNGMRPGDLGLLGDTDEMFTRDFLRALQICDIRQFDIPQSCRHAKLIASTLVFEGSPECISDKRRWYHPDIVIGYCLEGIGNSTGRLVAKREYKGTRARRKEESKSFPENVTNLPLFNGADFRAYGHGSQQPQMKSDRGLVWNGTVPARKTHHATAFHFHNFFEDTARIRKKYKTFGHPNWKALDAKLENLGGDIKRMVACAYNITLDSSDEASEFPTVAGGFKSMVGPMPIYYMNEQRRKGRHDQLRGILDEDFRQHGSALQPQKYAPKRRRTTTKKKKMMKKKTAPR